MKHNAYLGGMMAIYPNLIKEFRSYMDYWVDHMFKPHGDGIYPEMSIDDKPNEKGILGSMYLGRIIYGASQADLYFKTDRYRILADAALKQLVELKNHSGGYYWGRTYNMTWVHDTDNVNMAQAFVLYGLATYLQVYPSDEVEELFREQLDFIKGRLNSGPGTQFFDGSDERWVDQKAMSRSFGTHFHMMEALVRAFQLRPDTRLEQSIGDLIRLLTDRFIEKVDYSCIHRFSVDWQSYPNENWAGHNSECSWVMVHAARVINNSELIDKTEKIAVKMMEKVVKNARDERHGGYHNLIPEDEKFEDSKSWWPQAEAALGLINAHQITGEERYRELAEEQIEFIREYFVDAGGEWFSQIDLTGKPVGEAPKIFFWKSMYHTVRYYNFLLQEVV